MLIGHEVLATKVDAGLLGVMVMQREEKVRLIDRSRFRFDAVSPAVAGRILGLSGNSIRRLIREGHLPAFSFFREIRIRLDDLETFLQRSRIEPRSEVDDG